MVVNISAETSLKVLKQLVNELYLGKPDTMRKLTDVLRIVEAMEWDLHIPQTTEGEI